MVYVSVDIETTGLDPDTDQILQISAVVDTDFKTPVEELPSINFSVKHERLSGSPIALAMNAGLISKMAHAEDPDIVRVELWNFLRAYSTDNKIVAAGKNFASFDRQFLKRFDPRLDRLFHRRSIDPAMFWLKTSDVVPPSTGECLSRAGMYHDPTHEARRDTLDVIHLIRFGMARLTK